MALDLDNKVGDDAARDQNFVLFGIIFSRFEFKRMVLGA